MNTQQLAWWRLAVAALAVLMASSCGFELRGSTHLPFKTLFISVADTNPMAVEIKRHIRGNGPTQIVSEPAKAEAQLEISHQNVETEIVTINSQGNVSEYNIILYVSFRVHDGKGREFIPYTQLILKRLILANNNAVLAQNFEINQLVADMQSDAARQILRRMEAIELTPKP